MKKIMFGLPSEKNPIRESLKELIPNNMHTLDLEWTATILSVKISTGPPPR